MGDGYGCTIHLVGEETIRRDFVSRLLETERERERGQEPEQQRGFSFFGLRWGAPLAETTLDLRQTTPDVKRPVSTRRWRNMRLILEKRPPHYAARRLSELAIRYASKHLPYALVDERHVLLSLWDERAPEGVPNLPDHLLSSPEDTLFRDVVAAYPRVAGYFHNGFDGEPAPGVFVAAANVAPLLAWLRDDVLALLDANERRVFVDVVNVLEYAQERGYAYWEAAGLDVEESNASIFRRPTPLAAKELRKHVMDLPADGYTCYWGPLGRVRIISHRDARATVCHDLGTWPPREIGRPTGFLVEPALSRDERLSAMRYMPSESNYSLGYFYRSLEDRTWQPLALDFDLSALGYPRLGWFGDRAAALFASRRDREPRLFVQDGDRLVPGPALPPLMPGGPSSEGWHSASAAYATLASGETLLLWDGYAYQLDATGLTRRYDLGAAPHTGSSWSTVPASGGGFFFLSSAKLYELRTDGAVVRHARDIDVIGEVTIGPNGMLLLHQGSNSDADIGKIYDPRDGSHASLTRELFGFEDSWNYFDNIYWSRAADLIVVIYKGVLHALPTRVVLELPRRMPGPQTHVRHGFEVISEPAAGHGDRMARLQACYVPEIEDRLRTLLSNGKLTRPLRLGIEILDDGAIGAVTVLTPDPEVNAGSFARTVRKDLGPLHPPVGGALTIEVSMRFVSARERRKLKRQAS